MPRTGGGGGDGDDDGGGSVSDVSCYGGDVVMKMMILSINIVINVNTSNDYCTNATILGCNVTVTKLRFHIPEIDRESRTDNGNG